MRGIKSKKCVSIWESKEILNDLEVSHINLLTTNKDTEFVGIGGFGLDVVEKTEIV